MADAELRRSEHGPNGCTLRTGHAGPCKKEKDTEWIMRQAELEDGCYVSVGGLVTDLEEGKGKEKPLVGGSISVSHHAIRCDDRRWAQQPRGEAPKRHRDEHRPRATRRTRHPSLPSHSLWASWTRRPLQSHGARTGIRCVAIGYVALWGSGQHQSEQT